MLLETLFYLGLSLFHMQKEIESRILPLFIPSRTAATYAFHKRDPKIHPLPGKLFPSNIRLVLVKIDLAKVSDLFLNELQY